MTARGRYSRTPQPPRPEVRVVGTPAEVELIVGRIAQVLDIHHASRPIPRRDEAGRVSIHLHLETPSE